MKSTLLKKLKKLCSPVYEDSLGLLGVTLYIYISMSYVLFLSGKDPYSLFDAHSSFNGSTSFAALLVMGLYKYFVKKTNLMAKQLAEVEQQLALLNKQYQEQIKTHDNENLKDKVE